MFRNLLTTIASGAILCSGLLSAVPTDGSNTQALHPFMDVAYIPEGSDLSTIRFEKVRAVLVPAKIRYSTDASYCAGLGFRDPGGSAFCPSAAVESPVPAYEVTYSFDAPPMASDETAGRRFTFQVFLRPDDLTPKARKALSDRKPNRANIAEYFAVSTYRQTVRQTVIDESQSSFCDGSFVDGNWTHNSANCVDKIAYKTIAAPSGFITVRIDPVSSRPALEAVATPSLSR
jgi:hypothetical protein